MQISSLLLYEIWVQLSKVLQNCVIFQIYYTDWHSCQYRIRQKEDQVYESFLKYGFVLLNKWHTEGVIEVWKSFQGVMQAKIFIN